jgi:hypothetical protein
VRAAARNARQHGRPDRGCEGLTAPSGRGSRRAGWGPGLAGQSFTRSDTLGFVTLADESLAKATYRSSLKKDGTGYRCLIGIRQDGEPTDRPQG